MKYVLAIILIVTAFCLSAQEQVSGIVFEDKNGNGIKDITEKGIPNVVVSDQVNCTITSNDGTFEIVSNNKFSDIFIALPSGYRGKFYYPKQKETLFPLIKTEDRNEFTFIHASDTHMDSLNLPRMQRFREMADSINADFIIVTGDLVRDALRVDEKIASDYYNLYTSEIDKFDIPIYSGVGNHEIFGIERDKSLVSPKHPMYGKKMYRHFLGPNYYSFNYGGIHFISIDGVDYQNLYYFGGVDSLQLAWLEKDLAYVPEDVPIVTFNHIPFVSPGFSFQKFDSHIFYGPQLLLQKGKLEHRHIVYNFEDVKELIGNRPYPMALSGHYHSAQEGFMTGSGTIFAQTSAITRPDQYMSNGFLVRSGFTVYKVVDGKIVSNQFVPLNLP